MGLYLLLLQITWAVGMGIPSQSFIDVRSEYQGHDASLTSVQLALDIHFIEQDIKAGVPIVFDMCIRNAGTASVPIPLCIVPHGNTYLRITDNNKNRVTYKDSDIVLSYNLSKTRVVELRPGESWGTRYVAESYSATIDKPGVYTVQVFAHLEIEPHAKKRAWVGYIPSKPLQIRVVAAAHEVQR